ncbi:hypothetical protein OG301_38860 (plasmid) [Streptomyces platensis]|uniref:DUF6197 family protein n=1 Tax=Streptomyces platensis TaxID=58346 RepID=UPI002ED56C16|nr:hypothetical protein OG301_38860 [Streptomyces platensis]
MPNTAATLQRAAHLISHRGLHTGTQFVDRATLGVDICAAIYIAAEGICPDEFLTDEDASISLIQASARSMLAIQAVSKSFPTGPPVTEICPGHDVPDHIEHVCHWAMTGGRSASEVIGRILRTAHSHATPQALAA